MLHFTTFGIIHTGEMTTKASNVYTWLRDGNKLILLLLLLLFRIRKEKKQNMFLLSKYRLKKQNMFLLSKYRLLELKGYQSTTKRVNFHTWLLRYRRPCE